MIKYDVLRYLTHGAEIKEDLKKGKFFFETGRQHFTKYLPPRIAATYYYYSNKDLFNNFEEKKINLGVHFPYLIIQCLLYYLSLLLNYFSLAFLAASANAAL
jgi:ATP-dependent RNA circularization protein (DNA/RNA ligase family)